MLSRDDFKKISTTGALDEMYSSMVKSGMPLNQQVSYLKSVLDDMGVIMGPSKFNSEMHMHYSEFQRKIR